MNVSGLCGYLVLDGTFSWGVGGCNLYRSGDQDRRPSRVFVVAKLEGGGIDLPIANV